MLSRELQVLFFVAMLDTVSSGFLFHHGLAVEANPLLRVYSTAGTLPFVFMKLFTFVPGVFVLEGLRRRSPVFITSLVRVAIAAYLICYLAGTAVQFKL